MPHSSLSVARPHRATVSLQPTELLSDTIAGHAAAMLLSKSVNLGLLIPAIRKSRLSHLRTPIRASLHARQYVVQGNARGHGRLAG